jgi:16S rRNA (guanine(527)-N(7))-methyltransferase RsmG
MNFLHPFSFYHQMREEFIKAIKEHQDVFGLKLTDEKIESLHSYYALIQKHNPILHLVAPCSAEEFAVRHILESLALLEYLPKDAKFADVGTGAGLPSIPCLIVREDLRVNLIESKARKIAFLEEVLTECKLTKRARIYNRQFEEIERPDVSHVTCRALDKFTQKLPRLLKWSKSATLLLFAGNSLRDAIQVENLSFSEKLMPLSEQRFLFIVNK